MARLQAEQSGKTYSIDPANPASALQASIFAQRQAEYLQSINDFDARINSGRSSILGSRQAATNYKQRLDVASQVEQAQKDLQTKGFGRKLTLLAATDARVEMERLTSESQTAAAQGEHESRPSRRSAPSSPASGGTTWRPSW